MSETIDVQFIGRRMNELQAELRTIRSKVDTLTANAVSRQDFRRELDRL